MSGLPVHFGSFTVCAWVGLVPDAVANMDAENIMMPGNMSQPLAFIDSPPKLDWSNETAKQLGVPKNPNARSMVEVIDVLVQPSEPNGSLGRRQTTSTHDCTLKRLSGQTHVRNG
jgi:hypothetical protein